MARFTLPTNYDKLSVAERRKVRLQYVVEQNNKCCHCWKLLAKEPTGVMEKYPNVNWELFPKNFLLHPVHLHHNHKTGQTIGAVHSYCNAVLWQYFGE